MKNQIAKKYERIYREVAKIPEGTVATYGQIAERVGCGPREVGRALSELPPHTSCPWHRVINARGMVSIRSGTSHGASRSGSPPRTRGDFICQWPRRSRNLQMGGRFLRHECTIAGKSVQICVLTRIIGFFIIHALRGEIRL